MTIRPAGPLLDAVGMTLNIEDEQHITEVVVVAKATDLHTGETHLIIGASEGLDWIAQLGLLIYAARSVCDGGMEEDE